MNKEIIKRLAEITAELREIYRESGFICLQVYGGGVHVTPEALEDVAPVESWKWTKRGECCGDFPIRAEVEFGSVVFFAILSEADAGTYDCPLASD